MNVTKIKARLAQLLDDERYQHSLRVALLAQQLANHYQADPIKTQIAALLHDVARFLSREEMLATALQLNFLVSPFEKIEPKLLHARLGRHFAEKDFGISDPQILNAIEFHTVGRPNMELLEKIVYVADHVEIGREYPGAEALRQLAFSSLDQTIAQSTQRTIDFLNKKNVPVDQRTIATHQFYSTIRK